MAGHSLIPSRVTGNEKRDHITVEKSTILFFPSSLSSLIKSRKQNKHAFEHTYSMCQATTTSSSSSTSDKSHSISIMNRNVSSSSAAQAASPAVDIESRLNERLFGSKKTNKTSSNGGDSLLRRSGGKKGSKSCLKKSTSTNGTKRSNGAKKQVKRSISFDDYDAIFEIEHINDMNESIRNACWMKPEESRQIRKDAIDIVEQVNSKWHYDPLDGDNEDLESSTTTFRGLECHTDVAIQRRYEVQDSMYEAVLKIQEMQRTRGVHLPHAMADVCRKKTALSRKQAYEKALSDALAICES